MSRVYLSTAYFGNIQYYCKFLQHSEIFIEQNEHYSKQSYRNRCKLVGANGILSISVPVRHGRNKILLKDAKISYADDWQKNHYATLVTAYKSSPYFDYYIYEFDFVFIRKEKFLLDLNLKILEKTLALLKLSVSYKLTKIFLEQVAPHADYRFSIHPKEKNNEVDHSLKFDTYWQVFGNKLGFVANLSILDLLFNVGVDSLAYLRSCIKPGA